jgi:signal transduction histidine kinase
VILNIINNAKDVIDDKKITNGKIEIELDDKLKQISIKDNGGGIAEDVIERIFEPYFTTKEQGKGTGIGLYISKTIIDKNFKGTLSVKNEDKGAVFVIKL